MNSMRRVAAQLMCSVAAMALASCGSLAGPGVALDQSVDLPLPPAGPADRVVDVLTPNAIPGSGTFSRSATGATTSGTSLVLASAANTSAWGMYQFVPGAGNTLQSVAWDVTAVTGQGVFLATASYGTGRWVITGPFTTAQTIPLTAANLSPAGNMYALVVAFGGSGATIGGLNVTTDNPVLTHTVSGSITVSGAPLAGVTVSLTGQTDVTTGANGSFTFSNVPDGNYTLTPTLASYTFTPPTRSVTVSGADVTAQDFTAVQAVTYTNRIQALLTTNCTSCHGGSNPTAGIKLDTYADAHQNGNKANGKIQDGSMPPTGPLSAADKAAFQAWANAGYPQ